MSRRTKSCEESGSYDVIAASGGRGWSIRPNQIAHAAARGKWAEMLIILLGRIERLNHRRLADVHRVHEPRPRHSPLLPRLRPPGRLRALRARRRWPADPGAGSDDR